MIPRRFFRAGLLAYGTMVFLIGAGAYLGVLPTGIHAIPHFDLVMHLLLIGGVGFFLDGALDHRPLLNKWWSLGGTLVLIVAGIEEWAQRFSPRRSSSFSDYAADVMGVVLFVWLSRKVGCQPPVSRQAAA